ncbi:MAG: VanZ family protein [Candidatus Aenigmarchaeota archaeon]|nr:VanZ family protein [Candidatus Aenigmarchaeota archaeon]
MERLAVYRALLLLETAALLATSALPSVPQTPDVGLPGFREGYYIHFFAYFVYGLLAATAFRKSRKNLIFAAVIIGAGVGLAAEIIQFFTPNRAADAVDWMMDIAGSLAGGLLYTKLMKKRSLFARKDMAYAL